MAFRRPVNDPDYPDYPPVQPGEPEVILRQVAPTRFQLLHGFTYEPEGTSESWPVPAHRPEEDPEKAGNWTDLASVPPIMLWFIGTYGIHTKAALFHDHYVDQKDKMTRKYADTLFRDALRESGVRGLRRWLMWTAVSLFTRFGKVGVVVLCVHLVALAVTTAWWAFGSFPWWVPSALALAGFGWGLRRWPLAVFGFALVGLPAFLALVARLIAFVIEWFTELGRASNAKARGREHQFERPFVNPGAKKSF